MPDREKVIEILEKAKTIIEGWVPMFEQYNTPAGIDYAIAMLKEQEQEISRLKHHVDCDAAEKLPSGCVGYGRGFNDDEPCETCKACEKYNGYGEE